MGRGREPVPHYNYHQAYNTGQLVVFQGKVFKAWAFVRPGVSPIWPNYWTPVRMGKND